MITQFDELADAYEQSFTVLPFRRHIEMHSFLDTVGEVNGLRVLDLGCGSGMYTRALRRKGAAQAVGADNSEMMVDYARRREAREALGVDYFVHDAMAEPGEANGALSDAFDLVVSVYVLPYADSEARLTALCKNARKALKSPGQRFVAFVMNPDFSGAPGWYRDYGFELFETSVAREDGSGVKMNAKVGEHTFDVLAYYWSRAAHERALANAGFRDVRWIKPWLSEDGKDAKEASYWSNYLVCPHAMLVEAFAA